MLLLFSIKLVKLKKVWLAQIIGIDLFGDGGSGKQLVTYHLVIILDKTTNLMEATYHYVALTSLL